MLTLPHHLQLVLELWQCRQRPLHPNRSRSSAKCSVVWQSLRRRTALGQVSTIILCASFALCDVVVTCVISVDLWRFHTSRFGKTFLYHVHHTQIPIPHVVAIERWMMAFCYSLSLACILVVYPILSCCHIVPLGLYTRKGDTCFAHSVCNNLWPYSLVSPWFQHFFPMKDLKLTQSSMFSLLVFLFHK